MRHEIGRAPENPHPYVTDERHRRGGKGKWVHHILYSISVARQEYLKDRQARGLPLHRI